MPIAVFVMLVIFVSLFWASVCLTKMAEGRNWLATTLLLVMFTSTSIGLITYAYQVRPFTEDMKEVSFVDGKAVISEGDEIILLSKITGESYKPGDFIRFKVYADKYGIVDYCQSWRYRVYDIETVLHKAD